MTGLAPHSMLCVISPAKSLDYKSPLPPLDTSEPRFAKETQQLARAAIGLKTDDLKRLMHISDALGELNVRRFADFFGQDERAAIYAFSGDVYTGFEVKTLDDEAIAFAQDHVRILSGLYGLLRPLDRIRPYRLEMGTSWAAGNQKNLYAFWGKKIANALTSDMVEACTDVLINLASQEYWKAASPHLPSHMRIITMDFREHGPDGALRFNSFAAKRARGMMARYVCEHHLTEPEALKSFDSDGYAYDAGSSDGDIWRFTRA